MGRVSDDHHDGLGGDAIVALVRDLEPERRHGRSAARRHVRVRQARGLGGRGGNRQQHGEQDSDGSGQRPDARGCPP
jgi:hypothetical protein